MKFLGAVARVARVALEETIGAGIFAWDWWHGQLDGPPRIRTNEGPGRHGDAGIETSAPNGQSRG